MSPEAMAVTYAIAIVLFVVAAVYDWAQNTKVSPVFFVALGLAVATFVAFWGAIKAM